MRRTAFARWSLLAAILFAALVPLAGEDRRPVVMSDTGRPITLPTADRLKLPAAGPVHTILVPHSADSTVQLPATGTVAILGGAQTWTAAQNFSTGTTVIATIDANSGAIDGTAIGAAVPSTVAATTLTATGLTSGRIPYISTSGLIIDSAQLLFADSAASRGISVVATPASTRNAVLNLTADNAGSASIWQFLSNGSTSGAGATNFSIYGSVANDTPVTIAGAAGGAITLARPTAITGSLTVASDTDATTILGRARIHSPVADVAYFSHFDQTSTSGFALAQTTAGQTQVNATTGQAILLRIQGVTSATVTNTALTIASGVNLAMSGASTATFGTGAFTVNGAATINNTLTVTGESTFRDPVYFGKAGTGTAGSFRLLNDSAANQWFVGISGAVADKDYIMYDYTSTVERLRVTQSTGNFGWIGPASFSGAVSLSSSLSVSGTAATITSGAGTPEAAVTAPVGSLFMRTDGGASTTLYVKESGAGNTGWVAK